MSSQQEILVLVGPSGSGKTTISQLLAERGIPKVVTSTTRKPRQGEIEGVHYYFKTMEQMETEPFIEQTVYAENRYGLTVSEIKEKLSAYDRVQVTLDKNGAEAMKAQFPDETKIIFFQVSKEEMQKRMEARGDKEEDIKTRLLFGQQTKELEPFFETDLVIKDGAPDEIAEYIMKEI
ncbi:MAG: AAA family ATPase [Pisciglobus halotolerans]|nr:AAA family ATPase [Pisciglobus halotolerans]